MFLCRTPSALLLAVLIAAPASAQEAPDGLAGVLLRFFSPTNPVVLRAAPDPFSHAAHFSSQPEARATLRQLNRGIASQLSTFPLGSSSAGFTYTFDPALGVFNRSTDTFGPVFGERPVTAGKNKFSFGLSVLRATYDRFEGQDLRDGDIRLILTHQDTNADGSELNPWFEGDVIASDLVLDLSNDTTVLYANYGVSERLDIGVAIPYQRLDVDARIRTSIQHLATEGDPFVVHAFDDGSDDAEFRESGSAEGIGDIVLRGKYNFLRRSSLSLAAAVDLRLPTGDENDLLGSGATQVKTYLIGA
ncbi:MAG TPA: transporter, partial [Vicinamibacteria bacterium]|nr:transporter [Vicinamibacteria bacterium]